MYNLDEVEKDALDRFEVCQIAKFIANKLCHQKSYLKSIETANKSCISLTYMTDNGFEVRYQNSKLTITYDRITIINKESLCYILKINLGDPDMMERIEKFYELSLRI